jgi:hypothetical protein
LLARKQEVLAVTFPSGQEPDYEQIHATLDAEFTEWQAKLTAVIAAIAT